jgi:flagellar biosynthesis protein FlhF
MNARRFSGRTSREVLQKVKIAFGPDAMIVANNAVDDGVEVLALPAQAFGEAVASAQMAPPPASPVSPAPAAPQPAPATAPVSAGAGEMPGREILDEIQRMRGLLQAELAALSVNDLRSRNPVATALLGDLMAAGFSPSTARALTLRLPSGESEEMARRRVISAVEQKLPLAPSDEMIERGGVYALVGPTGVGKTTTVAKLAARAVVRHGAASVALLTTDSFRIAGQDQLRIYAGILGVPVHTIKDGAALVRALGEFGDYRLVLIDTMGMSQRDRQVAELTALLAASPKVQRVLLLNATASGATLDEVIGAYVSPGNQGCIITKVDEAASVAPALDACLRHALVLHYVTNGQRVPEDVHLPNRSYLLHRALRSPADPGLRPHADDLPLLVAARRQASGERHA